ncbi:MAG: reverse transcriptase/maturase family protein [Bryobacteraceae bacterium]
MKRAGNLWAALTGWPNLIAAAKNAAAGKRGRPDVAAYLLDLENEVARLRRRLLDGSYTPGTYRTFIVHEPKQRTISAAPFRDRVVHHALTQIIEPIFERRFSTRSFASRAGYGTHQALTLAIGASRQYPYVLQCDIAKYFPSIDHGILKDLLRRVIKCKPTLALADRIIDYSNAQEPVLRYFPGDSLFTPHERRRGLPLGNQTSQFFANVYLNSLDQFVMRELKPGEYARYVDDFILFGDSKEQLREWRVRIVEHLDGLRLSLHESKSRIHRTCDGMTFLGWRITPDGVWLKRHSVIRMRRRLRKMQAQWAMGEIEWDEIQQRVNSWIGHAQWGDTWRFREQLFAEFPFLLGGKR